MPKVSYVAYIDESGDDGLARVRPHDPNGASEWFVLGAIVVPSDMQCEARWVQTILADLKLPQRNELHFNPLDAGRRLAACDALARLPVRCFTVMSHKLNMKGHSKPRAAKFDAGRTYFYWWMTRLLLERITDYCERRALSEYGEPRLVRLEFARRGGLRYAHFQGYLFWLRMQSRTDSLYLKKGDLKWSAIDYLEEIRVFDPKLRSGLQLADTVASAFFQSVSGEPASNPAFAIALEPRMAFDAKGDIFDYGLKLMPPNYELHAPEHQRQIFEFYKPIRKGGRPPAPVTPSG